MKRTLFIILTATLLIAGCSSDKPERIEVDTKPPRSPCACGPRVVPLMWEAA